ncbi:hypothetical protein [Demequina sp. NBRC 110051]|uniref:LppM family (lipo)protein n=1 Tax=Demequina sp. NBRC 110051 TaxID=1570340 RepID=UPI000A04470C|nr:hypothetical protein [Demequina sp. NBRC 110051]
MSASSARSVAAVLAAALALAGCVRATADTTINADDTFSQHTVVAYSDSVASQITDYLGVDVNDLLGNVGDSDDFQDFSDRFPGQVTLDPYVSGDLEGIELTLTDIPLDDFSEASTQALASVEASATLERDDDTFVVDIRRGGDDALALLGAGQTNLEFAQAAVDVQATFTFPGLVQEAPAGAIEGHTVTLGLADLATTPHIRIVAEASDAIDWGPILLWAGIIAALAVIVGGAAWLIVDDRKKSRVTHLPAPRVSDE